MLLVRHVRKTISGVIGIHLDSNIGFRKIHVEYMMPIGVSKSGFQIEDHQLDVPESWTCHLF